MELSQEHDIKQYVRLLYRKRYLLVAIMVLVTTPVVAISYFLPTLYEARSTVLIERNFLNDIMKGIAVTPSIDDRAKAVSTIMKSRPLVLKVLKDLDLDMTQKTEAAVENLVASFQRDTETKIELSKASRKDMDMFVVSLRHHNPVIARDYVNGLVRRYIEESLSAKREETYGASRFLLEQIDRFKEKINAIEDKIAELSQQKGIASNEKLIASQKKLDELLLQYTDRHPEVVKMKDEIEALKAQARVQRKTPRKMQASEENPAVPGPASLPVQTETAKQDGAQDIRTKADPLSERNPSDGGQYQAAKKGNEQRIKELERDRDTYRKIYEDMLAALGRSEVSSYIEVSDKGGTFRILEPAVLPRYPVSPDRAKIILLGILGGIGAGVVIIILLDSMHGSINSVTTVSGFGPPVLAVIPHIELPNEKRRNNRKDLALYLFTGTYYAGVTAVLMMELIAKEMR